MTVEHRTDDTSRTSPTTPEEAVSGAAADGAAPGVGSARAGGLDRRRLLCGAAVAGVAGVTLAACGSSDDGGSTQGSGGSGGDGGDSGGSGDGGSGGGSGTTVPTSEVPVGGGRILEQEKVVVTQPAQGEFAAFTAVCTHQGCLVDSVEDGTISCPCHGSRFSAEDGSVTGGPAPQPLEAVQISVSGGEITLA